MHAMEAFFARSIEDIEDHTRTTHNTEAPKTKNTRRKRKRCLPIGDHQHKNKARIKPVWTYGIELWGCSKPSNTKILQTFQSRTLRKLANAPWYRLNVTLHNDLRIPYVTGVIRTYAKNHKNRTAQNNKQLIRQREIGRRLNRMWPEDLLDKLQRTIGGWYLLQTFTSALLLITLFMYLE
jgi:hypothetical protein